MPVHHPSYFFAVKVERCASAALGQLGNSAPLCTAATPREAWHDAVLTSVRRSILAGGSPGEATAHFSGKCKCKKKYVKASMVTSKYGERNSTIARPQTYRLRDVRQRVRFEEV